MAFLDNNGVTYLWSKITNAISTAVSNMTVSWDTVESKPDWIGDSKPTYTALEVNAVSVADKGTENGVATLDATGKVPVSQLPNYADDVVEGYYNEGVFYSNSSFATALTGETGKIYVDLSTNNCYRYDGSQYVEIATASISAITNEEIDTICNS